MDWMIIIVWGSLFIGWFIYKKVVEDLQYFDKYDVKYEKPLPIFGNLFKMLMQKENFIQTIDRLYNKYKNEQIFGFFLMSKPNFIITDPEVIKQITIKDFDSFVNHDESFNEDMDKISGKMLVTLVDEKWRHMRNILSPIFTSSKMKMMHGILSESAREFVEHFVERSKTNGFTIVDCKEAYPRYTVDAISTAVLGFKGDCIRNENSQLYKFALSLNNPDLKQNLKAILFTSWRWLYVKLGLQLTTKEAYQFFYDTIVKVMNERDEKGVFRPDVVQLLLQAKKGQLQRHDEKENDVNEKELSNFSANLEYEGDDYSKKPTDWTDEHYMAQGFLFFAAGFETTNILLQMTSYLLAKNRDIQQQLLDEVDAVLSSLDGKSVTYEALHKMKFLDMVISESLRWWPPGAATSRQCSRDYVMKMSSGKTINVKKGDLFFIPTMQIHRDERFFENPDKFDPFRFDDERKSSIVPGSYIPFGSGPRVCIGSRFALMKAKLLLFHVLSKFSLEVCDKTPEKIEMSPSFGGFSLRDNIYVKYQLRNK